MFMIVEYKIYSEIVHEYTQDWVVKEASYENLFFGLENDW